MAVNNRGNVARCDRVKAGSTPVRPTMKITSKRTVTKEEIVVEDVLCNKCGKSCREEDCGNLEGLVEARVTGGYASYLGDMTSYTFSLCEHCLEQLFATFLLPVEKHNMMDHGVEEDVSQ